MGRFFYRPHRDRVTAFAFDSYMGGAPESPRYGLGVLVVQGVGVLRLESLTGTPPPAQPLTLDGAVDVRGKEYPVVFVGLPQKPFSVGPLEMDRQAEVMGYEIGEAVGRHLVRDVEHLAQVLHGDVLPCLGFGQDADHGSLGGQHGCCEIVGLHPLAYVSLEIGGVLMT